MPEIETLPENLTEITIEAVEETVYEESETIVEDTQTTLQAELYLNEVVENLEDVNILSAPVLAASNNTVHFNSNDLIYTVEFNGDSYRVLFPENMREYLIVRDGYLLNTYGSSVVGLVLDAGDSGEINTYHDRYLTLYPFTNTSGNTNAYRYGGYAYLTTYTPYTGTQLNTQTEYGNAIVTQKPAFFRGFSSFELITLLCLALVVLSGFFRGLRHD